MRIGVLAVEIPSVLWNGMSLKADCRMVVVYKQDERGVRECFSSARFTLPSGSVLRPG